MGQNQSGGSLEDKYFLQKVKLGQGSFGTVWRAVDRINDRTVAIKQLDKAQLPKRGVKRQDIEREIAMMRASAHENLTQLYDTYEDANNIYLALEYCDGGDFGDKVKERGMAITEKEVADYLRQICAAMNALHSKHICHRDIKPDNFMVKTDPAGNLLKLTDFGLAIFVPPGKLLTEKCGTPAFMAPEQHRLPRESRGYSFAADVWAAGVSMFMVMFGGRHPFMNDRGLDDRLLLGGVLDFRESVPQKFFGFDMGMGSLRFSEPARDLCQRMVCPDERHRMTADDALRYPWLIQMASSAPPQLNRGITKQVTQLAPTGGAFPAAPEPLRPAGSELRLRNENEDLKFQLAQKELAMQEMQKQQEQQRVVHRHNTHQLPSPAPLPPKMPQAVPSGSPPMGALPPGTRCRYYSNSYGWMAAVVKFLNEADGTYDLDVRQHASLDKISPMAKVSQSEAWPPQTLVHYNSSSVNKWLPAIVKAYDEETGMYSLDVRDNADVDRIRARLSGVGSVPGGDDMGRRRTETSASGSSGYATESSRRANASAGNNAHDLRDGTEAAPLMLKDLAPGVNGAASGGLVRSPVMTADPQQRINQAYESSGPLPNATNVPMPAVWLAEGMWCNVMDAGLGEVVAVRDGAYDVQMSHEKLSAVPAEQIRAPHDHNHAWPTGTKVSYWSPSMGNWINGTVQSFTREGKYNLDVRQHAQPDRVRPRFNVK